MDRAKTRPSSKEPSDADGTHGPPSDGGDSTPRNGSDQEPEPRPSFSPSVAAQSLASTVTEDFPPDIFLSPQAKALLPTRTPLETAEDRIRDTFLVIKLAARLFTYLGLGWKWCLSFWRLVAFAAILLPGFAQMIVFYYFSPRVLRSIPYGVQARNRLDVYVPRRKWVRKGPCPVAVVVIGGAWCIGYKAWGALLARRLSQRGVLVFCLDYRNFPQGDAVAMVQDVNRGISWVLNNAGLYGGAAGSLHLVGQSAGAHLAALALLAQVQQAQQAQQQQQKDPATRPPGSGKPGSIATQPGSMASQPPWDSQPAWDPDRVAGFVGVSGAWNLYALADHLHGRGLYRGLLDAIMAVEGRAHLRELSPVYVARRMSRTAAARLPPVLLLHGTADKSVPMEIAVEFATALQEAGAQVALKLYRGKTHTQPIVEDPMRGGRDVLMDDVLSMVSGQAAHNSQFPMLPSWVIDSASWVCPF